MDTTKQIPSVTDATVTAGANCRQDVLALLSIALFYSLWAPILHFGPNVIGSLSLSLLVIGSPIAILSFSFRSRYFTSVSVLILIYVFVSVGILFNQSKTLSFLSLYVLFILFSGVLLGSKYAAYALALSTISVVSFKYMAFNDLSMMFWIPLFCVVAALAIIIDRALQLSDHWEHEVAHSQRELILRLRERQGELNRILKALDESQTRIKRTNDELIVTRQAAEEARSFKERFVANVSHELRTPLNLILGFAEVMYLAPESYDSVGWTPDLVADIGRIYHASSHLQDLVNDILDLARIDAIRLPMFREMVDVRKVVDEAMATIAPLLQRRNLAYQVNYPAVLPELFIDHTRMRQVLLNLLNNAARFTDHGYIDICVSQIEQEIRLSVRDTGVGISSEQLSRAFEEFGQTESGLQRRDGTGLGLALSQQLVHLQGGRIWAESEIGVGSTFWLAFPLPGTTVQSAPLQITPARSEVDLATAPLLFVDPDPSIAGMLERYLGDRKVLEARDIAEVDRLVESTHPLAVILNLPPDAPAEEWTGGLTALCKTYNVPILRCSIPSINWLHQAAGLNSCLTKPITRATLRTTLERCLREPGNVLVIDDDPGFVSMLKRMLSTMPLAQTILSAYTGQEGIRLTREQKPDLVFLDLLMPDMDGFQVLEEFRHDPISTGTTVIALTGSSYADELLLRRGAQFTITQTAGISAGTTIELLNALFPLIKPDYVSLESTSSSV